MLGYPCMNRTLRPEYRCNRTIQQKTWESQGIDRAAELVEQNTRDLLRILTWNINHDIGFYRCTSMMVPWHSEYRLHDLPNWDRVSANLEEAGRVVRRADLRFSFHPSHWVAISSPSEDTAENALVGLHNHARWMDAMGLPQTDRYPINIHVGGTYDDKSTTARRFHERLDRADAGVRDRLVVENDDRPNGWTTTELVENFGDRIPVTFDYHHHGLSSTVPYRVAFDRASETWDHRPVTHYSEPARLWGEDQRPQAHSEWVAQIPSWLLRESDVMIEAGAKERAIEELR